MIKLFCPYGCSSLNVELKCLSGHSFEKKNGIYYLHKDDETWKEVEKEAIGMIDCLKEDNQYHQDKYDSIDEYPYYKERGHSTDVNRVMFDMCKELIGEKRGVVLEIGAKNCWAINHFLKIGFESAVATDISDDELVALGWVGKLQEYTKRYFDRVVCDGAYLPFESNQFDVVFMCSTFHHLREKQKTMDEIYRVLKKDGVYVDMGENPRHPDRTIEDALGPVKREREKFNINETQPTVLEYWGFLDKAGFSDFYIYPFNENLLKENWDFEKDRMIQKIKSQSKYLPPQKYVSDLLSKFSERTKSMFDLERFLMFNYWLAVPSNTVMYGKK